MKKDQESPQKKEFEIKIPSFLRNKWFLISIISILSLAIISGLIYYIFFLFPKIKVSSFTSKIEESYKLCKEDSKQLDEITANWENTLNGDLDKKTENFAKMEEDFNNLNKKIGGVNPDGEIEETYKTLKQFSETGAKVSQDLKTIATYFKKVGVTVIAFNKLNTNSANLDELTKLVLDFKSISEQALTDLEKIEAPKCLINLDKDYKDLLRQYVKSADELVSAIKDKDTKKIETVGKNSDAAVAAINAQLAEDMKVFKSNSNFGDNLSKMKQFQKLIDEGLGSLRAKYGI